jgi:uncharacterized protein YegL
MTIHKHYNYDVAISYAGEDRSYADVLAKLLRDRGVKVFYDRDEKATLWGQNLYTYLSDLYQNQACYCVMFLSRHYATKLWTNHEREAAQARALQEQGVYILPIRLDETPIPGILPTTAHLNWYQETADSIVDVIIQKLKDVSQVPSQMRLRRLPVYLLLDCSETMMGEPLMAMEFGVQLIHQLLMKDQAAVETAYISVIPFSDRAGQHGLVSIRHFLPPKLIAGRSRATGKALHVLRDSIENDLVLNTQTTPGDYRPIVFLFTDGAPMDNYHEELRRLKALSGNRKPTIVAFGIGNQVDTTMLCEITDNVFMMQSVTPETFKYYIRWYED